MEEMRALDVSKIKDKLVIGTIGHFTLVLRADASLDILDDNGSHLDSLSQLDMLVLRQIVELYNGWSSCHKIEIR